MTSVLQKSLNELAEFMCKNPDMILATLKMAQDDNYFVIKAAANREWLHYTIVYFSGVPKNLYTQVLIRYTAHVGTLRGDQTLGYTEDAINHMDN